MRTIRLFVIPILGLLAASMAAPPAMAQGVDRYFCGTVNTLWYTDGNWWTNEDCTGSNGEPTSNDRAIIKADLTCDLDDLDTCSELEVRAGATLNLGSYKLSLNGNGQSSISDIDGTVNMDDDTSHLAMITNDQIWQGDGQIVGHVAGAQITIGGNRTLTNKCTIEGILAITEVSDDFNNFFKNEGTVDANDSGTVTISCYSVLDGPTAGAGLWTVSASGATLLFAQRLATAPVLDDDFTVSAGTLDLNDPGIDSSGTLTFTAGTIDCAGITGANTAEFTGS